MFGVVFAACEDCKEESMFLGNQHHIFYDWERVVHVGHHTHLGLLGQVHQLPVSHYLAWEENLGKSRKDDLRRRLYRIINKSRRLVRGYLGRGSDWF
jgi:hypothetical protein